MSAVTVKYTPEKGLPRSPGKPQLPSGVVLGGLVAGRPHNVNLGVGDVEALKSCRGWSVAAYKAETAKERKAAEGQASKEAEERKKATEERRETIKKARHAAKTKTKPKTGTKEPKA